MTVLRVGDRVEHRDSGWTGVVTQVLDTDGGCGQGPLVSVAPTTPRPADTPPDEWCGWKPLIVTSDELALLHTRPPGLLDEIRQALLDANRDLDDLLRLARCSARTRNRLPDRAWGQPYARALRALERLEA